MMYRAATFLVSTLLLVASVFHGGSVVEGTAAEKRERVLKAKKGTTAPAPGLPPQSQKMKSKKKAKSAFKKTKSAKVVKKSKKAKGTNVPSNVPSQNPSGSPSSNPSPAPSSMPLTKPSPSPSIRPLEPFSGVETFVAVPDGTAVTEVQAAVESAAIDTILEAPLRRKLQETSEMGSVDLDSAITDSTPESVQRMLQVNTIGSITVTLVVVGCDCRSVGGLIFPTPDACTCYNAAISGTVAFADRATISLTISIADGTFGIRINIIIPGSNAQGGSFVTTSPSMNPTDTGSSSPSVQGAPSTPTLAPTESAFPSSSPSSPPQAETPTTPTLAPTDSAFPSLSPNDSPAEVITPTDPPAETNPPLAGPDTQVQQGIATFYDDTAGGQGACGYATLPTASFPFGFQTGTGGSTFDDGYGCGACFEITCQGSNEAPGSPCGCDSSKKVVVLATDLCGGCDSNHMNMNIASFNEITSTDVCGIIKTTYRRVNCDFQGDIKIRSKEGTSGFFYGLHVDDVAGYGTLESVKLRQASSRESGQLEFDINCDKSGGPSFWNCDLAGKTPIQAPLDVLLTDSAQRTLEVNNVITDLGGELTFNVGENFPPIPAGPPNDAPVVPPNDAPAESPVTLAPVVVSVPTTNDPQETNSPTDPQAETNPPTDPQAETNPPTDPQAETNPPTDPQAETNPPTDPPAETNPPGAGPDTPLQEGIATYYGGTVDGGACGYNSLPTASFPFGFQVATGGSTFNEGYGCGACFEITCQGSNESPGSICSCDSSKKVVVQATDLCPECDSSHIDMNIASFNEITSTDVCGIIKTTYQRVSCDFQDDIKIRSKAGTSEYWYGLHVDDVAGYGALDSVKLRQASSRESGQLDFDINCDKSGGPSYWLCDLAGKTPIQGPLDILLTDSAQRTLEVNDVITDFGGDLTFNVGENFPPIPM